MTNAGSSWLDRVVRVAGTSVGAISLGGAIGTLGGPLGTAVGAIVGGVAGVFISTLDDIGTEGK